MNKVYYNEKKSIDLYGKTVVFTGGTDGMGRIAVEKMAKLGASIFLLGRNKSKTENVIGEIKDSTKKQNITYVHCDLSLQESVHNAAEEIISKSESIDFLINCAGANFFEHIITSEGYELSWATNHLGPFLLTNLLLDQLKKAPSARIVNLSSDMQKYARMEFEAILNNKETSNMNRYAQAKLAMIMCTQVLAKELRGTNITVNALNPGFINTNLLRRAEGMMRFWVFAQRMFASSPEVGANRILCLATSKEYEGVSGKFIHEDYIRKPNPKASDESFVKRVWETSKQQTGLM